MDNTLLRILKILQKNKTSGKNSITKKEFDEELENIQDFIKLQEEFCILLDHIEEQNTLDPHDLTDEQVVNIHLNLSYSIWHLEQVHALIKKLMRIRGAELLEQEQQNGIS